MRVKTRQLRALHETVNLLRHTIHRLKLVTKLRAQLAQQVGPGGTRPLHTLSVWMHHRQISMSLQVLVRSSTTGGLAFQWYQGVSQLRTG